ncbi:MAG: tetratricopeptide repeat protein [Pyrinomonadaceae bacterium]
MRKIAIFSIGLVYFVGCNNTPIIVQQNSNVNLTVQKTDDISTVSSHSQSKSEEQSPDVSATVVPKSDTKTKWTQSGNPIDTTAFDSEVKQAESKLKANLKDATLKTSLAEAYVKRGIALTDARQYASALGDYRRALKLDPNNEEAKKWIGQIISIYESINRSYPLDGEEPPPLPFRKET